MADPKQGTALMNAFAQQTNAPRFNRAIAKWAARELIDSYGLPDCMTAVAWYSSISSSPTWEDFVRVAGKCVERARQHDADIRRRAKNRALANEWRSK